jgi:endonuclease/exonuclease/phosphatase family metal-dependent hydrolase
MQTITTTLLLFSLFGALEAHSEEPHVLRVLTYNIHHGEGTDGKLDLERIATVIRSVEPDVVALQEVDRRTRRTNEVDQPARLGRLTQMKAIFERNIPFEGGEYGNAVLTRLPVVSHTNHRLPSHYEGEQRGALAVELRVKEDGPTFMFIATHLDYRPRDAERRESAATINRLVEKRPNEPAILAGDLNALSDTEVLADFDKVWNRANRDPLLTFPSKEPVRQIDYILYRPADRWRIIETRVIDEPVASDHLPLLAVLELVGD